MKYASLIMQYWFVSDCYCHCYFLYQYFQGAVQNLVGKYIWAPILISYIIIFQPSDFKAIVTVNVTTLLVLTTLFISIFEALPKTSYVKAVDLWLITNLMIPFFEMILQSLINVLRKDDEDYNDFKLFRACNPCMRDKNNSTRSIYKRGRENEKLLGILRLFSMIVLPAFYILFCFDGSWDSSKMDRPLVEQLCFMTFRHTLLKTVD